MIISESTSRQEPQSGLALDSKYLIRVPGEFIQQGDMFNLCPRIILPYHMGEFSENGEYPAKIEYKNSIVLSYSCDIEQEKIEIVLMAPIMKFSEYIDDDIRRTNRTFRNKMRRANYENVESERLKSGGIYGYYFIDGYKSDSLILDDLVVDFKNAYGIRLILLKEFANSHGNRVGLFDPESEKLSIVFGLFFSRREYILRLNLYQLIKYKVKKWLITH